MSTQHYICRNCQALVLENQLCKCQVTAPIVVTEQDIDDLFKDIEEDKKEFGWDDWCPAEERDKLLKKLHKDPNRYRGHLGQCEKWYRSDYKECSCGVALVRK